MTNYALASGTKCYIPDKDHIWLAASVISSEDATIHVNVTVPASVNDVMDSGSSETRVIDMTDQALALNTQKKLESLPLQNDDEGFPDGMEDMISLNYLHEAAILFNVKKRFFQQRPYTYAGDICIAVNPYQSLPDLYAEEEHVRYLNIPKEELPPHVYATSVQAYDHMKTHAMNQSILVSGESGAGKTETTKILMNHLATIAGGLNDQTIGRIIQVNPLLESFGNAKTVRNDNSSRFGKFIQLQFDTQDTLIGAKCKTFLFEKTRVVHHEMAERNYHIFYQLLDAPAADREAFQLDNGHMYKYTGDAKEKMVKIEGLTDGEHFERTKKALVLVGIDAALQQSLFEILAGVLQLGELLFKPKAENDEESEMVMSDFSTKAASLLGLDTQEMERAFCTRTMKARTEVYSVPLKASQACDCRDALAKAVYANIFDWLVTRVNVTLSNDERMQRQIGVLDIFGFEHFEHNSFEQFCINYANEKLQQKFTQDVFKTVQIEYEEENITWSHIEFSDNQQVLDVIESQMGIISLLNEELMRPKGNEESFVGKVSSLHKEDNGNVIEFPKTSRTKFTVKHYAAPVTYEAIGFLEKHKDALLPDLSVLMRSSSTALLSSLFPEAVVDNHANTGGRKKRGGALAQKTVGTQFKTSLSELMATIQSTKVRLIFTMSYYDIQIYPHSGYSGYSDISIFRYIQIYPYSGYSDISIFRIFGYISIFRIFRYIHIQDI